LAFYGDILTESNLKRLEPQKAKSKIYEYHGFDPIIRDKILLLDSEKRRAAKKDQFQKAKQYKSAMD
jgi:hypothetical protein